MHLLIDAYSTLRTVPEMNFRHEVRTRSAPGSLELDERLCSLMDDVMMRGGSKVNAAKYDVCRFLQRAKHHFTLAIDEAEMERFGEWADEASALYRLADGSLRDSYGRQVMASDGSIDPGAQLPYPADARARKARVEGMIEGWGIWVPPHLPPVEGEAEVEMRSAEETATRALALLLVARRAESLMNHTPIPVDELARDAPIAYRSLSPKEQKFVAADSPSQQEIINFHWRLEALHLLLWALDKVELRFLSDVCTQSDVAELIDGVSEREFLTRASFRPTSRVLDALDMHLRLHWAIREGLGGHDTSEVRVWRDVVPERHHALNWLVRFENADWDDVDTPT